jgi:ADP-heptose:LPS heptosyltransferase
VVNELNATAVILSGRDGNTAARVKRASADPSRIRVFEGLDLQRMAALIAAARLLVSNDTGPMHFGPALGVPTLGLFSVGLPAHFRPTGPLDEVIRENPIEKISVDAVIATVGRMWISMGDPDLRR